MTWMDVAVPLLIGLIPALLGYFSTQRTLRLEREKLLSQAAIDREAASSRTLAEVSGGAADVVSLLREETSRLADELGDAIDEIVRLKAMLAEAKRDRDALMELVEVNSRRNEEISEKLDRAEATIDILRGEVARLKKHRRDLIRQNAILVEVAEKTITR